MTVSRLRVARSETRELGDRARQGSGELPLGDSAEWRMSNATFFTAFVAIAAVLALLALVLH